MTETTADQSAAGADEPEAVEAVASEQAPAPLSRRELWLHCGGAFAFVVLLLMPHYATGQIWGPDWTTHAWMTWVQGQNVAGGGPSLFLHFDKMGVFFPYYAYYGGSYYAIGGALMQLIGGSPYIAYVLLWIWGVTWAYLGLFWISYQLGLRGWQLHAPSLILVTGAFYLTNVFARGAHMEFAATSAIPMFLASSMWLVRAERITLAPTIALIASTIVFTGAHNISLTWGIVILSGVAVVLVWALPRHGREFNARRVAAVAGLALLAMAANAWFLIPDYAYATRTQIANGTSFFHETSNYFNRASILLNPLRSVPKESTTPALFANLPVFVILWLLAAGWVIGRYTTRSTRRTLIGLAVIQAFLLVLLTTDWPWDHLVPRPLQFIQFSFRLQTYILMIFAVMALLLLRQSRRAPRGDLMGRILAGVLLFGVGVGVWQAWNSPDMWPSKRNEMFQATFTGPPTWYDPGSYRDFTAKVYEVPDTRVVTIPPEQVKHDEFKGQVPLPGGPEPIKTNIAGGPYLVRVTGPVRQIGRTPDGFVVIQRIDPTAPAGWVDFHIEPNKTWPVAMGRSISLTALLVLVGLLGTMTVRTVQERRATRRNGDAATGNAPTGTTA